MLQVTKKEVNNIFTENILNIVVFKFSTDLLSSENLKKLLLSYAMRYRSEILLYYS